MHRRRYAFQRHTSMVHRLNDIRIDERERKAAQAYLRAAEIVVDAIDDARLRLVLMGRTMKRALSRMLGEPQPWVSERRYERRQPAVR